MTTDILDLPGWTLIARHLDGHEYELEAEYTVQPINDPPIEWAEGMCILVNK